MTTDLNNAVFTAAELDYLGTQRLGRLVTLGRDGAPQVRPVGFRVSAGVIHIGGYDLAATQKFRNIDRDPRAAFLVDDLASVEPWQVRGVEVRGTGQAIPATDGVEAVIRIHPWRIITWGLDNGGRPSARRIDPAATG
ncbi:MAG: PPOX class F420-dependent oxidoreductase [Geodermatophilaceae bacterium]|nr:PPOX class F420-dependent oxidoreductase [Geodermatophilaceae bacterium]